MQAKEKPKAKILSQEISFHCRNLFRGNTSLSVNSALTSTNTSQIKIDQNISFKNIYRQLMDTALQSVEFESQSITLQGIESKTCHDFSS